MSEYKNDTSDMEEEEIQIKDVVLKLQEFFFEVLRNWKIVTLVCILFVAYFLYNATKKPVTYPAYLTFMVNEDEGNPLRSFGGGVLSGLMPAGQRGEFNLDKIIELSKSRSIMQRALFKKRTIDGKEDFIANHLIRQYNFHEDWAADTTSSLKDFLFAHDSVEIFTIQENQVVKALHGMIIGDPDNGVEPIFTAEANEDSGIMTLSINSTSEELSLEFIHAAYDYLSHFYIEKAIEKQARTFEIMQSKADSIEGELKRAEKSLADFLDSNRKLVVVKGELERMRLRRKAEVLNAMYVEIIRNLEMADFALKSKVPYIQELDKPIPPLDPQRESKISAIIIGGLIGGLLSAGFIIARKIYRDIMA